LQPAIDPAPALRSLIAAIPNDRLREFTLEILLALARRIAREGGPGRRHGDPVG